MRPVFMAFSINRKYVKSFRGVLIFTLIAALFIRGIIPLGYMPDFSKRDGFPAIAICGGQAHYPVEPAHAKNGAPCPFSVNAAFSLAGVQEPTFSSLLIFFV